VQIAEALGFAGDEAISLKKTFSQPLAYILTDIALYSNIKFWMAKDGTADVRPPNSTKLHPSTLLNSVISLLAVPASGHNVSG